MPLEFMNSIRFGRVNLRVLCLHMSHQMPPWPSIVPFSPIKGKYSFRINCLEIFVFTMACGLGKIYGPQVSLTLTCDYHIM